MDLYSSDVGAIQEGNMRSQRVKDANDAITAHNNNLADTIAGLQSSNQTGTILKQTADATGQFWGAGKLPSEISAYKDWTASKLASNPVSQAQQGAKDLLSKTATAVSGDIPDISDESAKAGSYLKSGIKSLTGVSDDAIDMVGKGAGVITSVATGGLDAYKEMSSLASGHGLAGDNWASKISDIGQIGGAIADVGGTVFPPLAIVGGVMDLASGAMGEIGDFIDSGKQAVKTAQLQASQTLSNISAPVGEQASTGRVS